MDIDAALQAAVFALYWAADAALQVEVIDLYLAVNADLH